MGVGPVGDFTRGDALIISVILAILGVLFFKILLPNLKEAAAHEEAYEATLKDSTVLPNEDCRCRWVPFPVPPDSPDGFACWRLKGDGYNLNDVPVVCFPGKEAVEGQR